MRASRLLTILMLLQSKGRLSATALAGEFEVSVRTIHRDIDQLSAAGVPVYAERGRSGGFELMDGYRTRLTGLTQDEAEALFLAGLPGPAAELGLADLLSAARLKLTAALPARMQGEAERIASRFHLDPVGWFRGADPLPALQTVARAVWSARYLKAGYRNSGQVYARKLAPLGLVLKAGIWYLVAQSGSAIRTYRVAAIEDATITDEGFARPRRFDLAAHWQASSRAYETSLYRDAASVRLSPKGMALLPLLGPHANDAARRSAARPDRRGFVRCTLPVEPGEHGLRDLLRFGDEIEILSPPALRADLAALAGRVAQRHARTAVASAAGLK
ncbi:MAG TPA: YafY family protein [Rhizomicrobium sp.]|jgi:predicted DNA-binding transcriptional regulator YafY|nr:YafY family protein [Rhizomicrobium sp.]